ncbi:MAG: ABC transporter permease [Candidatus Bipolaricaulia bacterium]
MKPFEILRISFNSLRANKLRSGLSMLGIIIGIASVIGILALGRGATKQATSQIESLGSNLITISPAFRRGQGGRISSQSIDLFTVELGEELAEKAPAIKTVVPVLQGNGLLKHEDLNLQATIVAVTPDYTEVMNYDVATGRFLSQRDLDRYSKSIILGSQVAQELFPNRNPIGQSITIQIGNNRFIFQVIGVMEEKGQVFFTRFDDQVYIPISTMMTRMTGQEFVNSYNAQAVSPELSAEAVDQLEFLLYNRLGNLDDFRVTSQQVILETISGVTETLALALGGIAGISLLVGGIGIMNIMLVSVTERTREIGIRKALGAKRRNILVQFLAESAGLSATGGLFGLLAGWGLSKLASRFVGFPPIFSWESVALAIGFSMAVGLFFGIYPALTAARLDPVEALRYE